MLRKKCGKLLSMAILSMAGTCAAMDQQFSYPPDRKTLDKYYMLSPFSTAPGVLETYINSCLEREAENIIAISRPLSKTDGQRWRNVCETCGINDIDEVRIVDEQSIMSHYHSEDIYRALHSKKAIFNAFMERIQLIDAKVGEEIDGCSDDALEFKCAIWKLIKTPMGNSLIKCFVAQRWNASKKVNFRLNEVQSSYDTFHSSVLLAGKQCSCNSFLHHLTKKYGLHICRIYIMK